jgi:hypothetical protein
VFDRFHNDLGRLREVGTSSTSTIASVLVVLVLSLRYTVLVVLVLLVLSLTPQYHGLDLPPEIAALLGTMPP